MNLPVELVPQIPYKSLLDKRHEIGLEIAEQILEEERQNNHDTDVKERLLHAFAEHHALELLAEVFAESTRQFRAGRNLRHR